MNTSEFDKYDQIINYFDKYGDFKRVKKIRVALDINPHYNKNEEVSTILSLFKYVLKERTYKGKFFYTATSGWVVEYRRRKKHFQENEDFDLNIYFSFVGYNTLE